MNWMNAHIGTVSGIFQYALQERAKYDLQVQYRVGVIQNAILMNAVMCDYNSRQISNGILVERGGMSIDKDTVRDFFVKMNVKWERSTDERFVAFRCFYIDQGFGKLAYKMRLPYTAEMIMRRKADGNDIPDWMT